MNKRAVKAMAGAIVASRELCGNESEAAREACFDAIKRFPSNPELRAAYDSANATWRKYQVEAGVAAEYCDGKGGLHSPAVAAALGDNE